MCLIYRTVPSGCLCVLCIVEQRIDGALCAQKCAFTFSRTCMQKVCEDMRVNMCMNMCTDMCIDMCLYTWTCRCVSVSMSRMHTYSRTNMHMLTDIFEYLSMYLSVYMPLHQSCAHVHLHALICLYTFIHAFLHACPYACPCACLYRCLYACMCTWSRHTFIFSGLGLLRNHRRREHHLQDLRLSKSQTQKVPFF